MRRGRAGRVQPTWSPVPQRSRPVPFRQASRRPSRRPFSRSRFKNVMVTPSNPTMTAATAVPTDAVRAMAWYTTSTGPLTIADRIASAAVSSSPSHRGRHTKWPTHSTVSPVIARDRPWRFSLAAQCMRALHIPDQRGARERRRVRVPVVGVSRIGWYGATDNERSNRDGVTALAGFAPSGGERARSEVRRVGDARAAAGGPDHEQPLARRVAVGGLVAPYTVLQPMAGAETEQGCTIG